MARRPFIDAHLHLWDRGHLPYPWLDDPAMSAIAPSYGIADYRQEAEDWNVIGCVHVEAGAAPAQSKDETQWLEQVAADTGLPNALVAQVALHAPDVEAQLAWQASRPMVRGIRHIVNWHPDPARQAYPADLTQDDDWQQGYAMLGKYGLSYDFHGHPPQLANLAKVAARHDNTPLIINHLGLPNLADGVDEWRRGLQQLAALPHASIKISGAAFITSPFAPDQFRAILREVVELFTPARAMIASNFPTDRLFASFNETLSSYDHIFADYSEDEQQQLWAGTANRVYELGMKL